MTEISHNKWLFPPVIQPVIYSVPRKGFGTARSADSVTIYTIYLSICTQTAVPNFPHPFRGTHSTCTFNSTTAMFSWEIDPDATPRPWTAFTLPFPIDLFPTPKVQEVQSSTPLHFGFPHTYKNLKVTMHCHFCKKKCFLITLNLTESAHNLSMLGVQNTFEPFHIHSEFSATPATRNLLYEISCSIHLLLVVFADLY